MLRYKLISLFFSLFFLGNAYADGQCPNPSITIVAPAGEQQQTVFSWERDRCDKYDTIDIPATAFVDQNNQVEMLLGAAGEFPAETGLNSHNYRMIGPSLDQLTRDCANGPVISGAPQNAPNDLPSDFDNWKWITDPWFDVKNQQVYAFVHNEFHGWNIYPDTLFCSSQYANTACWYPTVLLAESAGDGRQYQLIKPNNGPIIGTPYTYLKDGGRRGVNQGIPVQTNILSSPMGDGYLYIMAEASLGPPSLPNSPVIFPTVDGMCLFRSKKPGDPTEWVAWDPDTKQYNNSFTVNPYLQKLNTSDHTCKPIIKGSYCTSWSFNTVLNRYVLICNKYNQVLPNNNVTSAFVYLLSNGTNPKDPTAWDLHTHLLMAAPQIQQYPGTAYPSLIDPTGTTDGAGHGDGHNFEYSGVSPYFYYTQFYTANNWQKRDLKRVKLYVSCGMS